MFFFQNLMRNMGQFDLIYFIPICINSFKSQPQGITSTTMSLVIQWDYSRNTATNWTALCFHVYMFILFSVTSVNISLTCTPPPTDTPLMRLQFGNFSPPFVVLLLCSLVFPRPVFFYAYPAVLILSISLSWLNVWLLALPVWNLHISSTLTQHHHAQIHIETEVPVPEVVMQISPEHPAEA